jgi:glycosyltransferase involved in cell wall biosynthesis
MYNCAPFLQKLVDSVLAQDYLDGVPERGNVLELFLTDNHSTDNSFQLAQCLQEQYPDLIHVNTTPFPTGNPAEGRNLGLDLASGKFCIFIDSDDFIEPDYISTLVDCAVRTNSDVVVSSAWGDDKTPDDNSAQKPVSSYNIWPPKPALGLDNKYNIVRYLMLDGVPWGKLFNLELIKANNLRFVNMTREDGEFNLKVANFAGRVTYLEGYMGYHNVFNSASISKGEGSSYMALTAILDTYPIIYRTAMSFQDVEVQSAAVCNEIVHSYSRASNIPGFLPRLRAMRYIYTVFKSSVDPRNNRALARKVFQHLAAEGVLLPRLTFQVFGPCRLLFLVNLLLPLRSVLKNVRSACP